MGTFALVKLQMYNTRNETIRFLQKQVNFIYYLPTGLYKIS